MGDFLISEGDKPTDRLMRCSALIKKDLRNKTRHEQVCCVTIVGCHSAKSRRKEVIAELESVQTFRMPDTSSPCPVLLQDIY